MKHTSADLLEFDELKRLVGRYVSSPQGRTELDQVTPSTDRAALEEILGETGEAMEYLRAAGQPQAAARGAAIRLRFNDLPDTSAIIAKLRIEGAVLDAREILDLSEVLDRASDAKVKLTATARRFARLGAHAETVGEFRPMLRDLAGKILPDGSVADHATVALHRLRRDIERQQRLIQESLERFLRAHHEEGILQEEFVTIRNERFVIPVIAGQRRRVEGVIHGSSGTGQTLFVEPLETIDLNNELVRLREEELREVHRILREMTERFRVHDEAIVRTARVMGELELVFAKAQFAIEFGGVIPRFSAADTRRLMLRDARHPLLEDVLRRQNKPIIPISLTLENDVRTLLVSGPNTGGKTVTLKTVGLLALMAQAGLPVTCAEAEVPLFDEVLADIGDNQSIQESLSTFSAHIARIREMVTEVTPASLVLLDELGRATDPEEGGALGVAVLEECRRSGAFTLASTHLLALKVYGANTGGVLNGSVGFDEDTLEPTYVLRLGAPGKSAGLDIAGRLGLPASLIERARAAMGSSERDVALFLNQLHQRLESMGQLETELRTRTEALAAREKSLAKEWEKRESAKLRELERRVESLMQKFEAQGRETIDTILQGAQQKKAAAQAQRQVARAKREFQEEMEATVLSTLDEARQGDLAAGRPKIVEGATVRLKDIREPARVRRRLSHDMIEVEAGFLKLQVPVDDILEVLPSSQQQGTSLPKNVSLEVGPRWDVSSREINVIGKHAEEAVEEVDKFLDTAVLAAVNRVRIVHGHGMGILRKAIAELLASSPHVEKFYPAPPNEGGTGATIAELKED